MTAGGPRAESAGREFIRGLPKAELHLHIEGTLEPEMVMRLAGRHGLSLPWRSAAALREAYRFQDLQSFLDLYYAATAVLRDAGDFHALTSAYLTRAHADGIVHAEIFFDPQAHTSRGVPLPAVLEGIGAALAEAQRDFGISHRLILCFLRHLSAADAMRTLEEALPHRHRLAGIGLDSSEAGHPPGKFAEVFARARALGLPAVAHAGEEGPAGYIVEALDVLGARRIDHGVRCEEDPALVRRLAAQRIPLTICPLSNLRLGVVPTLERHNLKRLLDQGLCVTVNSDDPAYFGGYLVDNFVAVTAALGLTRVDLVQLARNSFEAAFLPESERARWLGAVERYVAREGSAPEGSRSQV